MKNIWTIMKKEFSRFFKDKRLVAALILPGVLIYLIYSFLGQGIFSKIDGTDENYVYQIRTVNMPDSFKAPFAEMKNIELLELTADSDEAKKDLIEKQKGLVQEQELDLFVLFSENFEADYQAVKNGDSDKLPVATVYYNTTRAEGSAAYNIFASLLSPMQQQVTPYFLAQTEDLATEKDFTGIIFSMIAPMLILMFLFAGCMSVAPESIAGEKERGSFATMLVTPVKRSHIAAGKIISLSVLSMLSGICSFLGIILSLPKLMGNAGSVSASVYGFADYMMILGVVLSSVLVIVALVSIISTFAKSVKEATSMISPLMILVMLLGVSTMFSSGSTGAYFWYMIPLYNSARSLSGIFSFASSPIAVTITVISNLVTAALLAFALAKMFDSEKIMFNK